MKDGGTVEVIDPDVFTVTYAGTTTFLIAYQTADPTKAGVYLIVFRATLASFTGVPAAESIAFTLTILHPCESSNNQVYLNDYVDQTVDIMTSTLY